MYLNALFAGMVFYGPIATLYRQAAGITVLQIMLIEGVSLALCVALELPWGIVADKIGYKKSMVICCMLYFLSKIVFWKAETFGMFLLERVMLSVVYAGLSGVDTSIVYLSCDEEHAQHAFGIYNNMCTIGLLIATAVFSLLVGDNYRLAGFLTVISYGVAALLSLGLQEVKKPAEKQQKTGAAFLSALKTQLGDKRLLLLVVSIALLNESHQIITVFLGQLQYVRCGMSSSMTGVAYLCLTLASLLGGLSARCTKRLGQKRMGQALFVVALLACAALAIARNAVLSVGLLVMFRIAFSLFQPLQTDLQNQQIHSADRATLLSVNAVLMDGVSISTNLTLGWVADRSLPLAFLLGAALCLTGLICFSLWGKGRKPAPSEAC